MGTVDGREVASYQRKQVETPAEWAVAEKRENLNKVLEKVKEGIE